MTGRAGVATRFEPLPPYRSPQPIMPFTHDFNPQDPDITNSPATQCRDCFGWYDDPRHLTPIPAHPLES